MFWNLTPYVLDIYFKKQSYLERRKKKREKERGCHKDF